MQSVHKSVLLHEIVEYLAKPKNSDNSRQFWYLDGTLGGAGHALAMVENFDGQLGVIGLDRDPQAIKRAEEALRGKAQKVILECENFRNLDKVMEKHGITSVDRILFDLGISSDELDNSGRGFSYRKDEPLLMTFGDPSTYAFTAVDIVNGWKEEDLANVIFGYGEERFARRIARAIVNYRDKKKIETSGELTEIVIGAIPIYARRWSVNRTQSDSDFRKIPAGKTFQSLRIAVNDELNSLKEGLIKGYERLSLGGRMAVISFHSLEDRIVKEFMKSKVEGGGTILFKKPLTPSDKEIEENPRSRSAKMRIIEKNF